MHGLEKIAYEKTKTMLQYVKPLVVYLVDGDVGMVHRDLSLLGEIVQFGLPVLVCCNKVDLLRSAITKKKIAQMAVFLQFAKYVPRVSKECSCRWKLFRLDHIISKPGKVRRTE